MQQEICPHVGPGIVTPTEHQNLSIAEQTRRLTAKPLFIPLRTQWFQEFLTGKKRDPETPEGCQTEYRLFGPRWNENTIWHGRLATICHGYSGQRLRAQVQGLRKVVNQTVDGIYPHGAILAAIDLRLL